MLLYLLGILCLDLLLHHLGECVGDFVVTHGFQIGLHIAFAHAHLLCHALQHCRFHIAAAHALHCLLYGIVQLFLGGNAHYLYICLCFSAVVQFVQIFQKGSLLVRIRGAAGGILERQTGENIGVLAVLLGSDRIGFLAVFNDILGQVAGIGNGAGQHRSSGIFIGADNASHFQFQTVVVEVLQAGFGVPQVGVQPCAFVIAVAVRIQDRAEVHAANVGIGPAFVVLLQFLAVHCCFHDVVHIFFRFQTEGV